MEARGEFRQHWRPLLASFIGMGSALSLNSFILSTMAPYLIAEFGWSRSQWALLGLVQVLVMICLPIAGRLTDLYGVRRVATVGALSFPVFMVLIATMNGDIRVYLAIYIAQTIICSTTTSTAYSRLVASTFKLRRGIALGISGSSPPLVGAIGAPLISIFVADYGWRSGYLAIAAFCAVSAVLTVALMPRHEPIERAAMASSAGSRQPGVYRRILALRAFWIMAAACLLVNLQFSLATSQLKLVVLAQGLSDAAAAGLVSIFAIGSIVGRLICGVALDILPGRIIAAVSFGLPVIGLLLLASSIDSIAAVTLAILLIGLSFGSEGDIIPYLAARYFGIGIFSTVVGLLSAVIGSSMALGSVILSIVLGATDSFNLYLLIAAGTATAGSLLFLMMGEPGEQGESKHSEALTA